MSLYCLYRHHHPFSNTFHFNSVFVYINTNFVCVCLMFMNNKYYTNVFCCTFNQNIWNFLALSNINRDTQTHEWLMSFYFVFRFGVCAFDFYFISSVLSCLSLVRCYRRWIDIWLGKMFQFSEQSTKIKN